MPYSRFPAYYTPQVSDRLRGVLKRVPTRQVSDRLRASIKKNTPLGGTKKEYPSSEY